MQRYRVSRRRFLLQHSRLIASILVALVHCRPDITDTGEHIAPTESDQLLECQPSIDGRLSGGMVCVQFRFWHSAG